MANEAKFPVWGMAALGGGLCAIVGVIIHFGMQPGEVKNTSLVAVVAPEANVNAVVVAGPVATVPNTTAVPETDAIPGPVLPIAQPPQFDVVRVEPDGSVIVAGRGQAGADVVLKENGRKIGAGKVNTPGEFVIIIPSALDAGTHVLTLETSLGADAHQISAQDVTVVLPQTKGEQVELVTISEPDKPTRILVENPVDAGALQNESTQAPAAVAQATALGIRTAEIDERGAFMSSGKGEANAQIRLYLNNSYLATVVPDQQRDWSFQIAHGLMQGHYLLRADDVNAVTGAVQARAEVAFDVANNNNTIAATSNAAPVLPEQSAHVKIEQVGTAQVVRGDSLWRISRKVLGAGVRYTQIYSLNTSQIRDPNKIYPGQVFVLPARP